MDFNRLLQEIFIDHRIPTAEELDALRREYPYFVAPEAVALAAGVPADREERQRYLRHLAATVADSDAVAAITGQESTRELPFYPDQMPPDPTTDQLIDSFLSRYKPRNSPDDATLERMMGLPSYDDYAVSLETDAHAPEPLPEDMPETPAAAEKPVSTTHTTTHTQETPSSSSSAPLTESLVNMMIKDGKYEKALEILSGMDLNNPKKSIYFADQIRFLRKVILIKNKQIK